VTGQFCATWKTSSYDLDTADVAEATAIIRDWQEQAALQQDEGLRAVGVLRPVSRAPGVAPRGSPIICSLSAVAIPATGPRASIFPGRHASP
jgi:hypothetical protein